MVGGLSLIGLFGMTALFTYFFINKFRRFRLHLDDREKIEDLICPICEAAKKGRRDRNPRYCLECNIEMVSLQGFYLRKSNGDYSSIKKKNSDNLPDDYEIEKEVPDFWWR